jgi:small subunit ribosomal protein S1
LGHKQVEANPWDAFEEKYSLGIETKGKISRLIDKGVIVTLPLGVDSFVPLNHLGKVNIKRASDHFKVDDELPLKVIEFDKENKRIVLSVSEYLKGKEEKEVESYMAAHNFTSTTMGELVKEVPEVLEGVPDEEPGKERPAKKPKTKKAAPDKEEQTVEEKIDESAEVKTKVKAEEKIEEKDRTVDKVQKESPEKTTAEDAMIADETTSPPEKTVDEKKPIKKKVKQTKVQKTDETKSKDKAENQDVSKAKKVEKKKKS